MYDSVTRRAGLAGCLLLLVLGTAAEATTVRVHYDVGYGNRITLRGSKTPAVAGPRAPTPRGPRATSGR